MKKTFCLDTNVLLYDPKAIFSFVDNNVVIPLRVLEELDSKKVRPDEVGYNARQTNRFLDELRLKGDLSKGVRLDNGGTLQIVAMPECSDDLPSELVNNNDNFIISTAKRLQKEAGNPVHLISKDISMRIKCDILGVSCQDYLKHRVAGEVDAVYTGYRTISVTKNQLDQFYMHKSIELPEHDFFENEFIILSAGSSSGLARFKNGIVKKIIEVDDVWGVKPRNKEQRFALDILLDPDVKFVSLIGKAGTGKTLLAAAAATQLTLDKKAYQKILMSRPIQPVGKDIGYLPGTKEEKMQPWIQPLMDNLEYLFDNNKGNLEMYFSNGIYEVEAITYIRGRSIPNSFIIIDESQNLSVDEVKTIMTRVGENTKIVLTGDIDQIDNNLIDAVSNGLTYAVEKFKEFDIAGHITLMKGERSELSKLASQIL